MGKLWFVPKRLLVRLLLSPVIIDFDRNHNLQWGRLYESQDVKIEWHGT